LSHVAADEGIDRQLGGHAVENRLVNALQRTMPGADCLA